MAQIRITANTEQASRELVKLSAQLRDLSGPVAADIAKLEQKFGLLQNRLKLVTTEMSKGGLSKENMNVLSTQYKRLTGLIDQTVVSLAKLGEVNKLSAGAIEQHRRELAKLSENIDAVTKSTDDLVGATDESAVSFTSLLQKIAGLRFAIGVVAAAFTAVASVLLYTTKRFAEFEYQLVRVEAISRASSSEMAKLSDAALDMASKTLYTATEAAEAMEFLALAGFNVVEIQEAIESVLNLAAIANIDAAKATRILTGVLRSYSFEASEAERITDILVATSTRTNTTLEELGYSFAYSATVAKQAGIEIEELAAITGLAANANIRASISGTAARRVMATLGNETSRGAQIFHEWIIENEGVSDSIDATTGKFETFADVIEQLEKMPSGLVGNIVQVRALPLMAHMIGLGADEVRRFTKELKNLEGASSLAAETIESSLSAKVKIFRQTVNRTFIEFVGGVEVMKSLLQDAIDLLDELNERADRDPLEPSRFGYYSFNLPALFSALGWTNLAETASLAGTEVQRVLADIDNRLRTIKDASLDAATALDRVYTARELTDDLSKWAGLKILEDYLSKSDPIILTVAGIEAAEKELEKLLDLQRRVESREESRRRDVALREIRSRRATLEEYIGYGKLQQTLAPRPGIAELEEADNLLQEMHEEYDWSRVEAEFEIILGQAQQLSEQTGITHGYFVDLLMKIKDMREQLESFPALQERLELDVEGLLTGDIGLVELVGQLRDARNVLASKQRGGPGATYESAVEQGREDVREAQRLLHAARQEQIREESREAERRARLVEQSEDAISRALLKADQIRGRYGEGIANLTELEEKRRALLAEMAMLETNLITIRKGGADSIFENVGASEEQIGRLEETIVAYRGIEGEIKQAEKIQTAYTSAIDNTVRTLRSYSDAYVNISELERQKEQSLSRLRVLYAQEAETTEERMLLAEKLNDELETQEDIVHKLTEAERRNREMFLRANRDKLFVLQQLHNQFNILFGSIIAGSGSMEERFKSAFDAMLQHALMVIAQIAAEYTVLMVAQSVLPSGPAGVIAQVLGWSGLFDEKKHGGGPVLGGSISSRDDTIITAQRGEFVMSRAAVQRVGVNNLQRLNAGASPGPQINMPITVNAIGDEEVVERIFVNAKRVVRRHLRPMVTEIIRS